MIEIERVWKSLGAGRKRTTILAGASLSLPPGRRIALLGARGAGKSTLIRLFTRLDVPDSGVVRSTGRICWPMSHINFVERNGTVRQNAYMLGHLYGADGGEIADIATELSGVNVGKAKVFKRYTNIEKRALALGFTLALQFDWYFVDDTLPQVAPNRAQTFDDVMADRFSRASVIWATTDAASVEGYCDAGLVLHRGKLRFYDTLTEASAAYLRKMENEGSKRE